MVNDKHWTLITCAYGIEIRHSLLHWNFLSNKDLEKKSYNINIYNQRSKWLFWHYPPYTKHAMSVATTEVSLWDVGALLTVWYRWGFNCSSSHERERAKEEASCTTALGGWTWFPFQNPQQSIERYCDYYISPPRVICCTLTIPVVFALVWLACLCFLR